MSYLVLAAGMPNFSQAVISLWFRVPQATIAAAWQQRLADIAAAGGNPYHTYPRMSGIIPLLTFGPLAEGYHLERRNGTPVSFTQSYGSFSGCALNLHTGSTEVRHSTDGPVDVQVAPILADPSYIGLVVAEDREIEGLAVAELRVRIQMGDNGSGAWVDKLQRFSFGSWVQLLSVAWSAADGCDPPPQDTAWHDTFDQCRRSYVWPDGTNITRIANADNTELWSQRHGPESFVAGSGLSIAPDHWHHALISFDLAHAMTATGSKIIYDYADCTEGDTSYPRSTVSENRARSINDPCQMWIALDDVNKIGEGDHSADSPFNPGYGGIVGFDGANSIAPQNLIDAAMKIYSVTLHQKTWQATGLVQLRYEENDFALPSYSYAPDPVPSHGHPLGIPSTPALVSSIRNVELAELQIFTGVTLDTGVEAKRRAFVDADGRPVKPSAAAALLGKQPEILLHRTSNWKAGRNTGTLGQFERVGVIDRYKPDPSLHGPQSPAALAGPVQLARKTANGI